MTMSDEAKSLIPRGSQMPEFQQQGTVDWGQISRSTVAFSVDALNRYSKAGVEAITVYAARAIFSQMNLGVMGEVRIQDALDKLEAFPTLNKALWMGFGVKHIVRSLRDHREGVCCIGICAALAEMYSIQFSAKVMRELFESYAPSADLTPALRQWASLVEACAGVLAPTEFGLILHQISTVFLNKDSQNLQLTPSAQSVAKTLKALFDVTSKRLDKVLLTGGSDCAWIASVAHWILDLSTEIQDGKGNVVYRPGVVTREQLTGESQVTVIYDSDRTGESAELLSCCYVIPSGKALISHERIAAEAEILSHGRVSWQTCLSDTFGSNMRRLLTSLAPVTGTCLGSWARIVAAVQGDVPPESNELIKLYRRQHQDFPISPASSPRGFYLAARELLPELVHDRPHLVRSIEESSALSVKDAIREYTVCISSLKGQCGCLPCKRSRPGLLDPHGAEDNAPEPFCLLLLVSVIQSLVRIVSCCSMTKGQEILPTRSGIEMLYKELSHRNSFAVDVVAESLMQSPLFHKPILQLAQELFTGRYDYEPGRGFEFRSGVVRSGICFYLGTICEITTDPERAAMVNISPGTIQWNNFHYTEIIDCERHHVTHEDNRYGAISAIVTDDLSSRGLQGSASDKLEAKLIVQESAYKERTNQIVANYSIFRTGDARSCFVVGPWETATNLQKASRLPNGRCQGRNCGSVDGISTLLVEGEGLLDTHLTFANRHAPIVRVIADQELAVWIALTQEKSRPPNKEMGRRHNFMISNCLQGSECLRCCIVNAINWCDMDEFSFKPLKEPYREGSNIYCRVCIVKPT